MSVSTRLSLALASAVLLAGTGCTLPDPPVTTVWQKLGVPQGVIGLRDSLVNRRGNFPGLERKPPLLPIAAPENLESPIKMLQVAAEVKQAEDLKKQKIKALKYLGKIGCGCYDKDGAIEAALLEALGDCTPDVRIAAAEAIQEAVGECACVDSCAQTCCTDAVQKKLAEIAYGEEEGCYIEPNAEVRAAALAALNACPPIVETEIQGETIPEALPETPEGTPSESASLPLDVQAAVSTLTVSSGDDASYYAAAEQVSAEIASPDESLVPSLHIAPEFADQAVADDGLIPAMVDRVDASEDRITVAFFDAYQIPAGTKLLLMRDGRELEVQITTAKVGRVEAEATGEAADWQAWSEGENVKVGILAE